MSSSEKVSIRNSVLTPYIRIKSKIIGFNTIFSGNAILNFEFYLTGAMWHVRLYGARDGHAVSVNAVFGSCGVQLSNIYKVLACEIHLQVFEHTRVTQPRTLIF